MSSHTETGHADTGQYCERSACGGRCCKGGPFRLLWLLLAGDDWPSTRHPYRAPQARLACPRLCFVGSKDEIQYPQSWENVYVSLADPIVQGQAELHDLGWDVQVLDGLDHIQAMQAKYVVPMLRSWLIARLRP